MLSITTVNTYVFHPHILQLKLSDKYVQSLMADDSAVTFSGSRLPNVLSNASEVIN